MRIAIVAAVLTCALVACGGGPPKVASTTETAQGAAMLWLTAALSKNDDDVRALSVPTYSDQALHAAETVRERMSTGDKFRWTAGDPKDGDKIWSAMGPGGVAFVQVHQAGDKDWRVADVQTSW